jgi:hypothetical protein
LKQGTQVTWSPLEQCSKKSETAAKNGVTESIAFIEEEIEESEASKSTKNSNTTPILCSLLAIMVVGGVAGFVYFKRDQREEHEYDADAVWPPPGSNLAPMGRTWTYPASGDSNPTSWEYSNQHGPLHDVVIN